MVTLQNTLDKKGDFWEKAEIYYFILTMSVMITAIGCIWKMVAREVAHFEAEFDDAHPGGFDLKRA